MKTVAVIEGFSGGPLKTRRFRSALVDAGFQITKNRHQADIIVAHSAGIYAIPLDARAHLLILIGPTYWPDVALIKRMGNHMKAAKHHQITSFGRRHFIWTKVVELYYFFTRNRYLWLGLWHNNKLHKLQALTSVPNRQTIIIRNLEDSYSGKGLEAQLKSSGLRFVEFPGIHDDYYYNPKPYVDLILKSLKGSKSS